MIRRDRNVNKISVDVGSDMRRDGVCFTGVGQVRGNADKVVCGGTVGVRL